MLNFNKILSIDNYYKLQDFHFKIFIKKDIYF